MTVHDSRFIIGIDLGTTNCAAYYVDAEAPHPVIKHLRIPQLTAAGEVGDRPALDGVMARLPIPTVVLHRPQFEQRLDRSVV